MISVCDVSKSFGRVKALDRVSFNIHANETVGFLGPNGAGKTTLMRLLTGVFPPSSGSILISGEHSIHSKKYRSKLGYLAEHNPLDRDMTAFDFLSYVAAMKNIAPPARQPSILKVAEQCSITSVLNRIIGKLSKGFQQRIGFAQALLGDPEILILDEPTNGLDPQQIIEVRKLIQQFSQKKTIILSTHILREVEQTCGRVFILNHGSLAATVEMKDGIQLEEVFLTILSNRPELCPK